ncbi:LysR family transcriptional regulator ArgP [Pseudoduganella buxea]|uniref:ArgP/LysG family DNA-binding transcriptional regulator n=1 Tax=Pseudoduganella buxea TaxID=1949069 RepID=A0A6I3SUA9_9BURK|nr:LysR family transcriptional regulator ArgP [Pseudoduganella buxea]MTV52731.1 ArgP/LysG family DNA-binding transcriptional regulator [Pseudoduganella buxea]GGC18596.1 chromosome replication initiation inhibitor [Pseudoduganella buxea]
MRFDPRQCDAFLAAADTGSFEQAAVQLNITPSATSQRIAALEMELGYPLLIRSRPCRPTSAGQRLLQYLRRSRLLEAEFRAELSNGETAAINVAIAVNNDTLATWLLPALAGFLEQENMTVEILLDDQTFTYSLLEKGLALAGVSSEPAPMRGCTVVPLGFMRYRLVAERAFATRWFGQGFQREAVLRAPVLFFDRKDKLQSDFIERRLGILPGNYPVHYVPSSDPFVRAIRKGLGYGMLPAQQYGDALQSGELVDLCPGDYLDVPLYWHAWRVQSPKLERLGRRIVAAALEALGNQA